MDQLLKRLEKLERENAQLFEVADAKRLALWRSRHPERFRSKMRVGSFQGKRVVGWRMVEDKVFKDADGRWKESQITAVQFEDGTAQDMPLRTFYLTMDRVEGEVIKRSKSDDGEFVTIALPDGKQVELDIRFVNP